MLYENHNAKHSKKTLSAEQKILDFMGSTELIANLFRISQIEEKLRKSRCSLQYLYDLRK